MKPDFDRMTESELLRYAQDKLTEQSKHLRRAYWGLGLAAAGTVLTLVSFFVR